MTDIVSFTGTQKGMSNNQRFRVTSILDSTNAYEFHHGDCIGADEQAHYLAKAQDYEIHIHPTNVPSKRAFLKGDVMYKIKPPMKRNTELAKVCSILIATPGEYEEILRSGTWSTIRRAKKLGREIYIIFPDGSYSHLNPR